MNNKVEIAENKIAALAESIKDTQYWLNLLKLSPKDQKIYDQRIKDMDFDDKDFGEDF